MKDKNYDLNRIAAMIASGQNLEACLEELRSVERQVRELKSRVAATKSVNSSGKKRTIEWPGTAKMPKEEALREEHFNYANLLGFFGYRVGKTGLETTERQRILKYVYFGELPRVESDSLMKRWGEPSTPKRLKMLVQSIVNSMGYTKEKSGKNDLSVAIRDWRSDLKWLKKAYYTQLPKGCFKWPIDR